MHFMRYIYNTSFAGVQQININATHKIYVTPQLSHESTVEQPS